MKTFVKNLLFIYLIILSVISAQSGVVETIRDTFIVRDSPVFKLSGISVVPNSERVTVGNNLISKDYFFIDYKSNIIHFRNNYVSLLDTITVEYKVRPLGLKKVYYRQKPVKTVSVGIPDTIRLVQPSEKSLSTGDIFGKNIEKSGTILRGFTVGTNKDFTVNSGLRLQLSGKISDDLEVVAALSDENTPIQPEGNTERLEELDKVFIQVKHPNAEGVFGDFDYNISGSEFGRVNRKLQGLLGTVRYHGTELTLALAGSRGKFATNSFNGIDGVQGPYRLTGRDNERNIIIIAGSEKVYIDGKIIKRGENNGYVIEYANGEITFTPNILITSASRIVVDFEYTDRRFNRNFAGINLNTNLFENKLNVRMNFFREGDDQDSPIDYSFNDNELSILRNAGDDKNKATLDGVSLAQQDSSGRRNGAYVKIDTSLGGADFSYYKYLPGDFNAIYNVSFSYVGSGKGDYKKERLGKYFFVGKGNGEYLPVRFLPLPSLKQNANISIRYNPIQKLSLNFELAGSSYDKNRFSELDDNDNNSFAYNIKLLLNNSNINLWGMNLGNLGMNYRERFINPDFEQMYRINDIEFTREYNSANTSERKERLREINFEYSKGKNFSVNATYGTLNKGSLFSSKRIYTNSKYNNNEYLKINHELDYVVSNNSAVNTDWMRQNGIAEFSYGFLTPGAEFLFENKEEKLTATDSLLKSSLRYEEFSPFIRLSSLYGINLTAKVTRRIEYYPLAGIRQKESDAFGKGIELSYNGGRIFRTAFTLSEREKNISDAFKRLGRKDNETILIRNNSRVSLLNGFVGGSFFYEASTQKTSKLEKVFIKVEKGTGNFIYIGDLNNNGIAEDNEYEPAIYDGEYIGITLPSEELIPVIDLKLNTRWSFNFGKMFNGSDFWDSMLKNLSMESYFRLEENSKEPDTKKIYLLNFAHFLNDSTTLRGFNIFQNDFHIFKNSRELSFRFRYVQKRSLNQFSSGLEKGYSRQRSLRIRFRMVEELSNETELKNETDILLAPFNNRRTREVYSNSITSDFSYRPERFIEVGFRFSAGVSDDLFPDKPTKIDRNSQKLRLIISLANKGRIRVEAERNELISNISTNYVPFEILKGNQLGKNYLWRLNFEYKIAQNLQITLNYSGRILGQSKTIHTMNAEAKAYF